MKLCAHRMGNRTTPPVARASARFDLSIWRTVSGEMDGAMPNSTTFPPKRRSVSARVVQAGYCMPTAITVGFLLPTELPSLSRSRLFPQGMLQSLFNKALANPAHRSSGHLQGGRNRPIRGPSSAFNRTRALVTMRTEALPPRNRATLTREPQLLVRRRTYPRHFPCLDFLTSALLRIQTLPVILSYPKHIRSSGLTTSFHMDTRMDFAARRRLWYAGRCTDARKCKGPCPGFHSRCSHRSSSMGRMLILGRPGEAARNVIERIHVAHCGFVSVRRVDDGRHGRLVHL